MIEIKFRTYEYSARELFLLANISSPATALALVIEFIVRRAENAVDSTQLWALPVTKIFRLFRAAQDAAEAANREAVQAYERETGTTAAAPDEETDILDRASTEGLEM